MRPRSKQNRGLPPNLYCQGGYYKYRNPENGKWFGLGRDKREAISQAIEANQIIADRQQSYSLADRIQERETFGQFLDVYEKRCIERGLKPATMKTRNSIIGTLRETFGAEPFDSITTRQLNGLLETYIEQDKRRMAQAIRSVMCDVFRESIIEGWATSNPAESLRDPSPAVKRARLTLAQYQQIHPLIDPEWAKHGAKLALHTGQRISDVVNIRRADIHDGHLWVQQIKTGNKVAIPLSLTLNGETLESVIAGCRDGVLSQYVVHYPAGSKAAGKKVNATQLTREFAAARDRAGIDWGDKSPATFHELRSLAERLYNDDGIDTQALLGHKDIRSTQTYKDRRGAEWIMVKSG